MAKLFTVAVFAFLATTSATSLQLDAKLESRTEKSLLQTWSKTLDGDDQPKIRKKQSPIQRVVSLLNEMKAQLEKEAEEDEETYDKMVCWCESNEKEKTKAIEDAKAKDIDLVAEIQERAARGAELDVNIKQLAKDIGEEEQGFKDARALREKEAGEFRDEEKELVQAIANLRNAITVLGKHHQGLIQLTPGMMESMKTVLRFTALKHEMLQGDHATKGLQDRLKTALISLNIETQHKSGSQTKEEAREGAFLSNLRSSLDVYSKKKVEDEQLPEKYAGRVLAELAQTSATGTKKQAPSAGSYAPASGQILGILKQMKEEFEGNLAQAQEDEKNGASEYGELSATKIDEIAAAKEMKKQKIAEAADNNKKLSDAKEDLQMTRDQLKADREFLQKLKLVCQDLDHQMEQRTKARNEEIKAVQETIAILTEDDAADLLRKTVTLIQLQSQVTTTAKERALRNRATAVLQRAMQEPLNDENVDDLEDLWKGRNSHSHKQLATLTVSVQLDAFTKVKAAMDEMIATLKKEQEEEVTFKANCVDDFNQNEKETFEKNKEHKDLVHKIEDLTATIERLTEEIATAKETIANMQIEIKKAGENREKENADYQVTVAEQRATQEIVKKALARMQAFYKKKALLQDGQDPMPPVAFKKQKKNAGGSPVISMLEMIIEDSKAVEDDAIKEEQTAQKDYETFVNDSNDTIKNLEEQIVAKTEEKGAAEVDKENSLVSKKNAEDELEQLAGVLAALHGECDFVLKNFDLRQAARLREIEAIQEAKAILSGAMN